MSAKSKLPPTKTRIPRITIKPNGNRLFIEPLAAEDVTEAGIIVPKQANENREVLRGRVIEVGDGMYTADGRRIAMAFKRGDVILYPKYCGNAIEIDHKRYLVVTEPDVLGIESSD